jgi:hypothetical protein
MTADEALQTDFLTLSDDEIAEAKSLIARLVPYANVKKAVMT